MRISGYLVLLSMALAAGMQSSFAQAVRNGLGDATTIVSPDKTLGSSGNPNEIGDFSNGSPQQNTGAFATRHMRAGNSGGIGGSFSGTTNVTAESSPARTGRIPETAVRALIPSSGVENAQTRLFSQSFTQGASKVVTGLSPDISNEWNASAPLLYGGSYGPGTIDFFAGHKKMPVPGSFSNTMGAPSFDSF